MTLSEQEKGIVIPDQNDNKITMDNNGIKIASSKNITLKATKDVKVEGMNLDLKAQTGFKAAGTASAEVSGASTKSKGAPPGDSGGAGADKLILEANHAPCSTGN